MAAPEIDMSEPLTDEAPAEDDEDLEANGDSDVDPMFAADVAEALPDLEDSQIAALQRAILGLIAGGGMGPSTPPTGGLGGF
jgi:hypothetical protein